MDSQKTHTWLNEVNGWLYPPGCTTESLTSPYNKNRCITCGIVFEHRFAFYYWALYGQEKTLQKPVLVTLDSHNDVGSPHDVRREDLKNLQQSNRTELGFFTWTRLRQTNDGHIRPALYLDFFSDVYVLINREGSGLGQDFTKGQQEDDKGNIHTIRYYDNYQDLMKDLPNDSTIYLDIDLDYFAITRSEALMGDSTIRDDNHVRSFLSVDGAFMNRMLDSIVGFTIALEPVYCGGFHNSVHLLELINSELFDGTLCTERARWKNKAHR